MVQIEVVEGYIDKVAWPPQLSRYHDFFTDYAAKITAQRPANIRTIERYLLLAGDLPGLKFKTSLRPSKHNVGAATLVVEVAEKRVDVNAQLDNRGTSARGPIEYLGSATINNPFGQHDALTFTYAGAIPFQELNYAAFGYKKVLTSEGLTFFADASDAWELLARRCRWKFCSIARLVHTATLACRIRSSARAKRSEAVGPVLRQRQRRRCAGNPLQC